MSLYQAYLKEIEERIELKLHPKPIDGADLLSEIIEQIKDTNNEYREASLNFFIYNVLPGTTSAASVKAEFLKEIILGTVLVEEISVDYAFEQLSHMKGGPSVRVLLDLALGTDATIAAAAAAALLWRLQQVKCNCGKTCLRKMVLKNCFNFKKYVISTLS